MTKNQGQPSPSIDAVFEPKRFALLDNFAAFAAQGDDATTFLQGQLTNDVKALSAGRSNRFQRTGYCTPKGRLLASMLQWQSESQAFMQVISADLLQETIERLKMFVLRSKVTFTEAAAPMQVAGLWGRLKDASLTPGSVTPLQGEPANPAAWLLIETPCPVLGDRAWLIASPESMAYWQGSLLAKALPIDAQAWMFSEIQNAKAWVTAPTRELFVPQMINFEITDGVSFTKGCYPGQEVVARSQYLGKLKRRSFLADIAKSGESANSLVGADVWNARGPDEPCGRVVNAAQIFDAQGLAQNSQCLLLELPIADWENGDLHLVSRDGPAVTKRSLPYEITDVSDRPAH